MNLSYCPTCPLCNYWGHSQLECLGTHCCRFSCKHRLCHFRRSGNSVARPGRPSHTWNCSPLRPSVGNSSYQYGGSSDLRCCHQSSLEMPQMLLPGGSVSERGSSNNAIDKQCRCTGPWETRVAHWRRAYHWTMIGWPGYQCSQPCSWSKSGKLQGWLEKRATGNETYIFWNIHNLRSPAVITNNFNHIVTQAASLCCTVGSRAIPRVCAHASRAPPQFGTLVWRNGGSPSLRVIRLV